MRNQTILITSLILVLVFSGCIGDKITAHATMDLTKKVIKNGDTTTIKVNGKNTGTLPANVVIEITSEDPDKLMVTYPGNLEYALQPDEDTGTKLVKVQGFTEYSSTKYWIKMRLINKANNAVLDEKTEWITVTK